MTYGEIIIAKKDKIGDEIKLGDFESEKLFSLKTRRMPRKEAMKYYSNKLKKYFQEKEIEDFLRPGDFEKVDDLPDNQKICLYAWELKAFKENLLQIFKRGNK